MDDETCRFRKDQIDLVNYGAQRVFILPKDYPEASLNNKTLQCIFNDPAFIDSIYVSD